MSSSLVLLVLIASTCFTGSIAQIPRVCSDAVSIANKRCCPTPNLPNNPGVCGTNLGRGECQSVQCNSYNSDDSRTEPRLNWPAYFYTTGCNCTGNYGGYDCGECKFGYTGTNCTERQSQRMRKSMNNASADEWNSYIKILKDAKRTPSRYVVLLFDESIPRQRNDPITGYEIQNISIYNLFAWMHHYVAKTNNDSYEPTGSANDYAHESAGFLTWHRLFLLWFEREIHVTLNQPNFALYYWDWTIPDNRDSLFVNDRLGGNDGSGNVTGNFDGNEWQTVCWFKGDPDYGDKTCNISNPAGIHQLIRCSDDESCSNSEFWPTENSVSDMMNFSMYRDPSDVNPYNKFARLSFSNYLEGFVPKTVEEGADECNLTLPDQYPNTNCKPLSANIAITRALHNLVHITLGIGFIKNVPNLGVTVEPGTMADVAASSNDPVFLNHHTMIDCLFDEWLKNQTDAQYVGPNERQFAGHNKYDCIVPFIPLYTHNDMFKRGDDFGYSCDLPPFPRSTSGNNNNSSGVTMVQGGSLLLVLFLVISLAAATILD